MPEQTDGSRTDRVDAALGVLVDEVGAQSRAPGADRAIRTAGRRRAAFAAGTLVVVLVAVAGFGTWERTSTGVPVVAPPTAVAPDPTTAAPRPDPNVPPAARLDLDRLNRASAGWVVWEAGTADVTDVSPCRTKDAPLPEPLDSASEQYRVRDRTDASFERITLGSRADSNKTLRTLIEGVEACPDPTHVHNADFRVDLEVVAYTWGTGSRGGVVWLVNNADRVDVLEVVGAPKPSDAVIRRVSALLAADVQVP